MPLKRQRKLLGFLSALLRIAYGMLIASSTHKGRGAFLPPPGQASRDSVALGAFTESQDRTGLTHFTALQGWDESL